MGTIALNTDETLDTLADEYARWCHAQGLCCIPADEHDRGPFSALTEDQKAWLADFERRWDVACMESEFHGECGCDACAEAAADAAPDWRGDV